MVILREGTGLLIVPDVLHCVSLAMMERFGSSGAGVVQDQMRCCQEHHA